MTADQQARVDDPRHALDSYGDLLVADAFHHLVEGRADTAGAVMNAAAGPSAPPDLGLLNTTRHGRAISSSIALATAGQHFPWSPPCRRS